MKINVFQEKESFQKFDVALRRKLLNLLGEKIGQPPFADPVLRLVDGLQEVEESLQLLSEAEG